MERGHWSPPVIYFLALFPLVIGSHAAASAAFVLYDRAPESVQKSEWIGYVLNDVAPALAGVVCAVLLAALLVRASRFVATTRGFLVRTMPWYLLAAAIAVLVVQGQASPDFGLWSQIITWPLAALLAGLATDALVTWRRSSSAPAV
jgi:hypothetical protein